MLRKGRNNRRVTSIRLDDSDSEGDSCVSRKRGNNRRLAAAIRLEDSGASEGDGSSSDSSSSSDPVCFDFTPHVDKNDDQEDREDQEEHYTGGACTQVALEALLCMGNTLPTSSSTNAASETDSRPPVSFADLGYQLRVAPTAPAFAPIQSLQQQQIVVQSPPLVVTTRTNVAAATCNTRSSSASITQAEPTFVNPLSGLIGISDINALSKEILNGTTGGIELTDEEKLACINSTKYTSSQASVGIRFLETIKAFCGPKLKRLAEIEFKDENGIDKNGFVLACQGEKHPGKRTIINYAMTAVVKTWRMTRKYCGKEIGDQYEPGTFVNFVKAISKLLDCCSFSRQNADCKFNLFLDFKGTGEWISILQQTWCAEMMLNPEFGRKPFAGKFDPSAPEKVEEALRQGTLSLDNHRHVLLLTIYCLGYHWWLRGSTEQTDREWSEVSFFIHSNGNNRAKFILSEGKSTKRIEITLKPIYHLTLFSPDKCNKLYKLSKDIGAVLPPLEVEDPSDPNVLFKPVVILQRQHALRDPNSDYIHRFGDRILFHHRPKGQDVVVKSGEMTGLIQELALTKIKNHSAGRKAGITDAAKDASGMAAQKMVMNHARHKNIGTTQAIYNLPSEDARDAFVSARGGNAPTAHQSTAASVLARNPKTGTTLGGPIANPYLKSSISTRPTPKKTMIATPTHTQNQESPSLTKKLYEKLEEIEKASTVKIEGLTRTIEEKDSELFERDRVVENLTRTIEEKDLELFERDRVVEELKNSIEDIDGRYHESFNAFSSLQAKIEHDNRNTVSKISALKAKLKTKYNDLKDVEGRKRRKMTDDHGAELQCLKDEVHHLKDNVQRSKEEVQRAKEEVQRAKDDHTREKFMMTMTMQQPRSACNIS